MPGCAQTAAMLCFSIYPRALCSTHGPSHRDCCSWSGGAQSSTTRRRHGTSKTPCHATCFCTDLATASCAFDVLPLWVRPPVDIRQSNPRSTHVYHICHRNGRLGLHDATSLDTDNPCAPAWQHDGRLCTVATEYPE